MVRKIFKKHKDNQNKIKPRGRKRKIFATIVSIEFTVWQTTIEFFSIIKSKF